jgi:methylase of polypeptide subunit release factors
MELVEGAARWLGPGGSIVLEIASGEGGSIARLATTCGLTDVEISRDLSNRERIFVGRRAASPATPSG